MVFVFVTTLPNTHFLSPNNTMPKVNFLQTATNDKKTAGNVTTGMIFTNFCDTTILIVSG